MTRSDIILSACRKIAANGHGALIVVEGQQPLDDVVASGAALDAPLSEQLLVETFDDSSPLHDGAVVVRGNRIVAASCTLPIVPRAGGHTLGLRHRAAMHLSETCDATIYVVSQQRGTITEVRNSQFTMHNENE